MNTGFDKPMGQDVPSAIRYQKRRYGHLRSEVAWSIDEQIPTHSDSLINSRTALEQLRPGLLA